MSDQFWISFFNSLPVFTVSLATLVSALGALYISYQSSNKLHTVSNQIDGMKDELVKSTAKASLAEGKAIGTKEEQDRVSNGSL